MKIPEWPGIATAVAIVLIATIAIAMASDPDFKLKDWQPTIAAIVALIGGMWAYKAATHRTDFEREIIAVNLRKRKLVIFLKVNEALNSLHDRARTIDASLTFPPEHGSTYSYDLGDVAIRIPSELEEAWSNIDIFPHTTIQEIFSLRRDTVALQEAARFIERDETYEVSAFELARHPWSSMKQSAENIWQSCAVVTSSLASEIASLAPSLDYNEKMIAIHGEPDGD